MITQSALVNTAVGTPPSVLVRDGSGTPVAGVTVTFAVTGGGGTVLPAMPVVTDASGIATVGSWTVGATPGANTLSATATGSGITGNPVLFAATGLGFTIAARSVITQSAPLNTAVRGATLGAGAGRDWHSGGGHDGHLCGDRRGGTVLPAMPVVTDASGIATVASWTLGATQGANTLSATATRSDITGNPVLFAASGLAFTQQGLKLVGTGAVGAANQGYSVSLSADGNTAIVGGYADNGDAGAAWVWTRSGGVWTQQGSKLVGTGAVGAANQGYSVSLSADGNTAIVGGVLDNDAAGAAWVWTRSGGVWTQQGSKLVGTGAVGTPTRAFTWPSPPTATPPSLEGLETMVMLGPRGSGPGAGVSGPSRGPSWSGPAGWGRPRHFRVPLRRRQHRHRRRGLRTMVALGPRGSGPGAEESGPSRGSKLVGTGAVGNAEQGYSVSLSADGNTAIVGGDDRQQ